MESMSEMKEASAGPQHASLGDEIIGRIDQLAAISETPEHLTRIFLTKEHRAAADVILGWMRGAGMRAHLDAIGNVCGRYEGEVAGSPCLMLGSHYDSRRRQMGRPARADHGDFLRWRFAQERAAIAVRDRSDGIRR